MAACQIPVPWLFGQQIVVSRDFGVILGRVQRFGANTELSKHPWKLRLTQNTHSNKHTNVPGAAVRTQTHDSWQCLRGPRPESGPADRRQTRLCLKYTGTAMCKHTHINTYSFPGK